MKKERVLSMLLAASLAAAVLSSCGDSETSSSSSGSADTAGESGTTTAQSEQVTFPLEEPVTMTMFAITNNDVELPDSKAFQKMTEMTNVQWEVQSVLAADLLEKRNLLVSSNDYPDVFCKSGFSTVDLAKYGGQGIFLDLTDYIETQAPNFKAILEENPAIQQQITSGDGAIYSLPEVSFPIPGGNVILFINEQWLENLGLSEPTNLDELYNVLKAFKDNDPNGNGQADEIPFIGQSGFNKYIYPYFGIQTNGNDPQWALMDGNFEYVPSTEKYKEVLEYMTKLYQDGLLEKNSFTNAQEQQSALGNQGDILGMFYNGGAFQTVGYERCFDYKELTPFEEGVYPSTTGAVPGTYVVTDNCENPEIAVAWADQWYTEEGGILAWMGIEGESYQVIDDEGHWEWILDGYDDVVDMREHMGFQGSANHPGIQPEAWRLGTSDPSETQLSEQRQRLIDAGAEPFPTLNFSDADNKTISTVNADIDPYVNQYMAQVVTGELDLESSWDEYIATLNNMGLQDMVNIYRNAYEEASK